MDDAVLRGFASLGILTAGVLTTVFVGACLYSVWSAWQACRDLQAAKRVVIHPTPDMDAVGKRYIDSIHRPLVDCTCACRWLNRDPSCSVHGMADVRCTCTWGIDGWTDGTCPVHEKNRPAAPGNCTCKDFGATRVLTCPTHGEPFIHPDCTCGGPDKCDPYVDPQCPVHITP